MKQMVIQKSCARPIFVCFTELWNFYDGLGPGLRDNATALTLYGFPNWPEIWWDDGQYHEVDRCLKCPCLANFCTSSRNFSWQAWSEGWWLIWEMWENHIMVWNLVASCNVPWSGSLPVFEMATLSQCSHFLILAGQGWYPSLNVLFFVTWMCLELSEWSEIG